MGGDNQAETERTHALEESIPMTGTGKGDTPSNTIHPEGNGDSSGKDGGESSEKAISKKTKFTGEVEEKPKRVTIIQLFRFSTTVERLLMGIACIAAMVSGVALPLLNVFLGDIITTITTYNPLCDSSDPKIRADTRAAFGGIECGIDKFNQDIRSGCIIFAILGCVQFACVYLHNVIFSYTAETQARRIREAFFHSLLSQDQGWFDSQLTGGLVTRITADIAQVQEGLGPKMSQIVQFTTSFFTGIILGFTKGWQMTLVIFAGVPVIAIAGGTLGILLQSVATQNASAYAGAGAVASQAFTAIRTVVAFGGEAKEERKYEKRLDEAYAIGRRAAIIQGTGIGVVNMLIYFVFAFGFWYGSTLVASGQYNGGQVLTVFLSVLVGAFSLATVGPNIPFIFTAQGAAFQLYAIIDRKSPIDPLSQAGERPPTVQGRIELRNVTFRYPSRTDVTVLDDFSLVVEPGQTVALVGGSGSGKSTIVKLVERFYDAEKGQVLLDGRDVKALNVDFLRTTVGIVSQEPVLFDTSVRENILYGLSLEARRNLSKEKLDEMVISAAKMANAHEFVSNLPKAYDTVVGAQGGQISGGQKQRVAIARAIIGNPRILLLDEATSALDTTSERLVQAALDKAAMGRTTIVVAHRLSTIKNASKIVVMKLGKIVEAGTHEELIGNNGLYSELVRVQELRMSRRKSSGAIRSSRKSSLALSEEGRISTGTKHLSHPLTVVPGTGVEATAELEDGLPVPIVPVKQLEELENPETEESEDDSVDKTGQDVVLSLKRGQSTELMALSAEERKKRIREAEFERLSKQPTPWFRLYRAALPQL
ncbi:ATP-binding cassette, sub-B (MDR TAP), member 4 [Gonapodya sp. JEL0774]|nr:ATP-binding cassette, sub-B (MDR TAP), member 4 [Gonapodya sp. JEL0774]